jgi:hypothetical protein
MSRILFYQKWGLLFVIFGFGVKLFFADFRKEELRKGVEDNTYLLFTSS